MKNKRRKKTRYFIIMFLVVILSGIVALYPYIRDYFLVEPILGTVNKREINGDMLIYVNIRMGLYSEAAYLYNMDSQVAMLSLNEAEIVAPASLTKIMSVLVAIEHFDYYDEIVTIPSGIFPYLWQTNSSLAGFNAYEQVTINDLLYGTLLPSGGEAALSLAYEVAGDEEAFVELMNEKAKQIGLNNTSFAGSIGLDDKNTYSTAKDMATLLMYALENDKFKEVFYAKEYTTSKTNYHPEGIELYNSTYVYLTKNKEGLDYIFLGSKTGYTENAMMCLASVFQFDGVNYLLVTMKADGQYSTKDYKHFFDAELVYETIAYYK